jgi:thiol:disulfide interchange protein DsbA
MNVFKGLMLSVLLAWPLAGFSQEAGKSYQAGVDYDLITPSLRARGTGKIEVVEFFAYSCGHCYNFEPALQQWKKGLADDVALLPTPAVWSAAMEPHARAFFTAQALGVLDTMHGVLFAAMHVDNKRLASEAEIRALFVANGVSAEDFNKTFNSFGVGSQVRQAQALAKSARVTGTPEIMVAGKYRVTARKAAGQGNMLKIADFLIEQERAAASAE